MRGRGRSGGRQVAYIAADPERAVSVRTGFEPYATGEWIIERLAPLLEGTWQTASSLLGRVDGWDERGERGS